MPFRENIDLFNRPHNHKEGSLEYVVYHKLIIQKRPCCLSELSKLQDISRKNILMVSGENLMFILKILNSAFRKEIFIGDKPFYSPIVVHYLSWSMNGRTKAQFNRHAYTYLQGGFLIKASREASRLIDLEFPSTRSTFRNAGEYIKHYTSVSDVEMKDFTFVFLFYIAWSIILLTFSLHRLTRALLRSCNKPSRNLKLFKFVTWVMKRSNLKAEEIEEAEKNEN